MNAGERLVFKLKLLRKFLKNWNITLFGSVLQSKLSILNALNNIDVIQESRLLSPNEITTRTNPALQFESI